MNKLKSFLIRIKPFVLPFAVAISIPVAIGILSAALTRENMQIYDIINKPPLSPPAILFPIVWTILYILMGISSAMIYTKKERNPENAKKGLCYYGISLVLNFAWSIIFFNLESAFFALLVLILLLFTIVKTILEYRKVCPAAAYLQIPYAIWVSFAGYLNAAIWLLN